MFNKKIIISIPGFNFGGIELTFFNLCKYISTNNIKIILLVEEQANSSQIDLLRKMGITVYVLPNLTIRNIFCYIYNLNNILKKEKVYSVISYNILRTPIIFILAIMNGVKHRIYHSRTNLSSPNFYHEILLKIIIRITIPFSTHLWACSMQAGIYFFGNKKFEVVKNPIDAKKFQYDVEIRKMIRSELRLENKFVVGHVGRFCEAKNHLFIIDVFKELLKRKSNAVLMLIGEGPLKERISQKVKRMGIEDNVLFMGFQQETSTYYHAMDVFLFPSLYEGFGNVALEAQASGLKVIASTAVSQETKITELISYISLTEPLTTWVNKLIDPYIRVNSYNDFVNTGYDVTCNIERITNTLNDL